MNNLPSAIPNINCIFMRHFIFLVIILILFSCNADKKKSAFHFEKANKLFKAKDYKTAAIEIETAIRLDSFNNEFKFLNAKIQNEIEDYSRSIEILHFLIKEKYKMDTSFYFIAENYSTLAQNSFYKKNDAALSNVQNQTSIQYYDSALSINGLYFGAYLG
jgi:tetratricopeptide (TPR) repeat protein